MLHVLAMIGLIALIVIAVIALLVLLFFFLPFKYKVRAIANYGKEIDEEEESLKKLNVKAVIYWLFHFLRIEINLDKSDFKYKVRLLGIVILSTEKSEKKKVKKREKERKEYRKKKVKRQAQEAKMSKDDSVESKKVEADETSKQSSVDKLKEAHKNKAEHAEEKEEKSGFFAKIKKFFAGIKKIITFLRDEENKKTFKLVKEQLLKALKEIRPRKFKGYVSYGLEDPADTGKLLGVIAVAFGVIGKSISVVPDFENKKFDGDFFIKGRFRVAVLLGVFLKLYKDKNIKKLLDSVFS